MSADELRRAASLMRERAQAATPGPWEVKTDYLDTVTGEGGDPYISAPLMEVVAGVYDGDDQNAAHIAAADPPFMLTVADWLDHAAGRAEAKVEHGGKPAVVWSHERDALAVARAYLDGAR